MALPFKHSFAVPAAELTIGLDATCKDVTP
jgi:hypothetical protein